MTKTLIDEISDADWNDPSVADWNITVGETKMTKTTIDDIDPKFHKAWHYANDFMATAIKSEKHCEIFLEGTDRSTEEKEFLLWAWVLITTGQDTIIRDGVIYTCYDDEDDIENDDYYEDIEDLLHEEETNKETKD